MPTDPIQGEISPRKNYAIYWRAAWDDPWSPGVDLDDESAEFVDRVLCGPIEQTLNPAIDRTTLVWRSGDVKYEDQAAFVTRVMGRFLNSFIKISVFHPADPPEDPEEPTPDPTEEVLFVGYVPEQAVDVLGQFSSESPLHRVNQQVAAYGLELLLDRNTIGESWCANTGAMYSTTDWARRITHALTFNQMYERGFASLSTDSELSRQGNRSPSTVEIREDFPEAYVFFGGGGNGVDPESNKPEIWSAYDIAEYLLSAFAPSGIKWRLKPGRESEETADLQLFAALNRYQPQRLAAQGRTIKDLLDELFNAAVGLAWRVKYVVEEVDEADEEFVDVEIISLADEEVELDEVMVLPASGYTKDITIPRDETIAEQVVQEAIHDKYGTIIVEGSRVLCCFTLLVQGSPGDGADPSGELVPAWTSGERAAYDEGAESDDPGINDVARTADKFRHVYTTFRVRRDWNLSLASSGGDWGIGVGVNNDGGLVPGATSQFVRLWGTSFANFLPILTAEAQQEFDREYLPPLVVMKDDAGRWHMVDRSPGPSASLRMLDRELGIEINATPNHLIALGEAEIEAYPSATDPAFEFWSMKATVAMYTDLRLSVTQTIEGLDPERVLRVLIEDAEAWWVQPGAVIDVNADGSLITHAGGVVRSDRNRLAQIAAMIRAWYGRPRRALSLSSKFVNTSIRPGDVLANMIENDGSDDHATALATPVTLRRIDLEAQTTQIGTEFLQPAFKRLARRGLV